MKKLISVFLIVIVLCATLSCMTINADAAEAQPVVSLAAQQVGGEWPNGLCLAYIATIFNQSYGLDGNVYSSCCAYQNGNRFIDSASRTNIPVGACVYFGGSSVICSCGNYAGHIAIHIGEGNVVHAWAGQIVCTSIDYIVNCGYPYRGYGWYADMELSTAPVSYATITKGSYALKNSGNGTYVVVRDNLDLTGQNVDSSATRAGFEIKKSTTTEGYALRALCSASRLLNVYADRVTSGNVVCIWDDTGHASQRWLFEEVSGGYVIRSVETPSCVLDIRNDGHIYVSTYTGAASQIWELEKFCTEHTYTNSCDTSCNNCGETRTTSHSYNAATCTSPKTCKVCGTISGSKLGHAYSNNCDTSCNRCGAKRSITHSYTAATCTTPKTCKVCGTISGSKLGHAYSNNCDTSCNRCSATRSITHSYSAATCTSPKTCKVCGATSGSKLNTHTYENGKCCVCGKKALAITKQPASAKANNGKYVTLEVGATGDGLNYQWYYKNKNAKSFKLASKLNGKSTIQLKMSKSADGRQIYCKVTDKYSNTVTTQTVTISMKNKVTITKQPVSVTVKNGKVAKVSVNATGDGLTYQWYYKNAGGKKFVLSRSMTGNTYTVKMSSGRNGRKIYCVITDQYGNTVQTNTVTLNIRSELKIVKQPASAKAYSGDYVTVKVKATGDGLNYEWYYKNKTAKSYKLAPKLTGSSAIKLKMSNSANGRKIYCKITDKYGNTVKTKTITISKK